MVGEINSSVARLCSSVPNYWQLFNAIYFYALFGYLNNSRIYVKCERELKERNGGEGEGRQRGGGGEKEKQEERKTENE